MSVRRSHSLHDVINMCVASLKPKCHFHRPRMSVETLDITKKKRLVNGLVTNKWYNFNEL